MLTKLMSLMRRRYYPECWLGLHAYGPSLSGRLVCDNCWESVEP